MNRVIRSLAATMQHKMDKNEHKECPHLNPSGVGRDWTKCSVEWLIVRAKEELVELEEALAEGDLDNAILECADVANFMAMAQDNIAAKMSPNLNINQRRDRDEMVNITIQKEAP